MASMAWLPSLARVASTAGGAVAAGRCAAASYLRRNASATSGAGFLTHDSLNSNLKHASYAVRGEVVLRALAHQKALADGKERPFKSLIFSNIGNPHELGQAPITFARQVFAVVNCPELLQNAAFVASMPADVIARAKAYLAHIPGGTGAYTASQGLEHVRNEVAKFISKRDGFQANASDIFLTDGASPAVQMIIRASVRNSHDAFMIPIPQYPLYSASLALYGGSQVGYYLNETGGWSLEPEELRRSFKAAEASGKHIRGIAVINPGNPTGNCLSDDQIATVLTFAAENRIMILADEVYQDNIWHSKGPWKSFKRIACEMGLVDPKHTAINKGVQLASFHSTSKGFMGECGRRGGYVELCGFDDATRAELYKLASISLCSNAGGQVMMGLMVNPPQSGEPSYALYNKEKTGILSSLHRRAVKLVAAFRKLEGVTCEAPEGALYVFPRIRLPAKAITAAEAAGKAADLFYVLALLDDTGIVVVPGSGFGQAPDTFHFRSTILPSEKDIDGFIDRISKFHARFMNKYR